MLQEKEKEIQNLKIEIEKLKNPPKKQIPLTK
jgi:hypothetical protein